MGQGRRKEGKKGKRGGEGREGFWAPNLHHRLTLGLSRHDFLGVGGKSAIRPGSDNPRYRRCAA